MHSPPCCSLFPPTFLLTVNQEAGGKRGGGWEANHTFLKLKGASDTIQGNPHLLQMRKQIPRGEEVGGGGGERMHQSRVCGGLGGGEDKCGAKQEVQIPEPGAEFPVPPGNLELFPTAPFSLQGVRSPIPETTGAAQTEAQSQIKQPPAPHAGPQGVPIPGSPFQSFQGTQVTADANGEVS